MTGPLPPDAESVHFEIQRHGDGPEAIIDELGRAALARVITVMPPPEPSETVMRALTLANQVYFEQLNRSEQMAVYEVRSVGQSVSSWRSIQQAIRQFDGILNAHIDPHTYYQATRHRRRR